VSDAPHDLGPPGGPSWPDADGGPDLQAAADRTHHEGCHDEGFGDKFEVRRTDGSDQPGGRHHGCTYFPLDLTHDPIAREVALQYALKVAVVEGRTRLALELARVVRELETAAKEGR
jgi:hypothetical protein